MALLSKAHELCGQQSKWFPPTLRDRLGLLLVDAHTSVGQPGQAMALLRGLCMRWPASLAAWSRYCRVSASAGIVRSWSLHVSTMRRKCPSSLPVMVMQVMQANPFARLQKRPSLSLPLSQGHVHSMNGQYIEALQEYFHAYRFWPNESLLLLSIAVAYLNLAATKRVPDRNRAVLNAFTFMQVC